MSNRVSTSKNANPRVDGQCPFLIRHSSFTPPLPLPQSPISNPPVPRSLFPFTPRARYAPSVPRRSPLTLSPRGERAQGTLVKGAEEKETQCFFRKTKPKTALALSKTRSPVASSPAQTRHFRPPSSPCGARLSPGSSPHSGFILSHPQSPSGNPRWAIPHRQPPPRMFDAPPYPAYKRATAECALTAPRNDRKTDTDETPYARIRHTP
jgi:hypothetical protein